MAEKFILEFARLLADHPEEIEVKRVDVDDTFSQIEVKANKSDTGKLIGRQGKMISSLKTILTGCKAKENRSYRVTIDSHEG